MHRWMQGCGWMDAGGEGDLVQQVERQATVLQEFPMASKDRKQCHVQLHAQLHEHMLMYQLHAPHGKAPHTLMFCREQSHPARTLSMPWRCAESFNSCISGCHMLSMEGFGSFLNTKLSVSAEMIWLLLMDAEVVGGAAGDGAGCEGVLVEGVQSVVMAVEELAQRMAFSKSSEAEEVPEAGCSW